MFKLKNLKTYTLSQLYYYKTKAMLSQGNGYLFSKMLENRINKIDKEITKRHK